MMHIHGFMTSLLICLVAIKVDVVHAEVRSASACNNSDTFDCNLMTLGCNAGTTIRLLTMKYGSKLYECKDRRNDCLRSNRNGCCVYAENDCTEDYNKLDAYNLHKQCSGKQLCEDLSVPNKVLKTCNGEISRYVQVNYRCVPDKSFGDFCDSSPSGNDINLLFKSDTSTLNERSNCTCLVRSPTGVRVEYVDVRMFKDNDQTSASLCSSASLVSEPESSVNTSCDERKNFIYAKSWEGPSNVQIKLINLHSLGPDDQPGFIWLNLIGTKPVSISVHCGRHADFNPTTPLVVPITTSQGLPSSGTTDINSAPLDDDSSNSGAIVAGVLIPIIIILVICIVLFIIWKRRSYLFKRASSNSRSTPNTYLDGTDIENCIENEEYAEIGFVPDEPHMSTAYDTVYEPRVKPSTTSNSTAPTYVITSKVNKAHTNNVTIIEQKEKQSKNLKFSFDKMKSSKDRLISFFKKQGENDFPSAKPEKKSSCDKTEESYDHLRPTSACSGTQIDLLTPTDDPKHTYLRISDIPVTTNTVSVETNQSAPTTKLNAKSEHDEINAVHVGDAYIEFRRGPMDKDHPYLIKTPNQEHDPNDRPNPPSRPPPSPGKGKRKDGCSQNLSADVSNNAFIRSNSPNHLSPVPVGSRSVSPVGSGVSSSHSYKALEPQAVYDYADLSDDELGIAPHPPEVLYVDGRISSVRKPVSVSVIPDADDGYLKPVPRTASTAALPESNEQPKGMAKSEAPKSQFSLH